MGSKRVSDMTEWLSLSLSSILVWKTPWTEEPGQLQFMGSQRADTTEGLTLSLHFLVVYILQIWHLGSRDHFFFQQDTILLQCPLVIEWWLNIAWASQVALVAKNPPAKTGDLRDLGSIPRSGRCPRGGNGNPLQYSCLENPKDRGAWQATVHGVTKSRT